MPVARRTQKTDQVGGPGLPLSRADFMPHEVSAAVDGVFLARKLVLYWPRREAV